MNLKFAVKLAVAVSVLSAAPAMATSVTPPSAGPAPAPGATTGSGLMVQVWDTTTNKGFVEWLGNTYQSFLPGGSDGATTPGTLLNYGTLDGSGWSAFYTAAISAGDTVDFNVAASYSPGGGVANVALMTGPNSTAAWTTGQPTTSGVNNIAARQINELGSSGALYQGTAGNCNPCISTGATTDPAFVYLTSAGGGSMGATGSTAAVGSTLGFYEVTAASSTKNPPTISQYASGGNIGTWTLSTAGDLVYQIGGATVPLPAAGWLLVSGLMGLVGMGRRRAVA